jgi:hypothetical protein
VDAGDPPLSRLVLSSVLDTAPTGTASGARLTAHCPIVAVRAAVVG